MTNLENYLEAAMNGTSKELAESMTEDFTIRVDGELVSVRELLLSTDIAGTSLVQTEVLKTIIEGADQMKAIRDALPTYNMPSRIYTVPVGETSTYAPIVAEGAEIPIETQDYAEIVFKAEKRAVRPLISNELVSDSVVDVISAELKKAGKRIENSLNQDGITKMLDGSSLEVDTAETAADQGVVAIATAISKVQDAGYTPDSVLMHPEALAAVIKEFVPGNYDNTVVRTGSLGKILGLDVFVLGVTDASSTYTWGYASNGEIGMLVFDSAAAAAIGMREDIGVDKYEDVVRDLQGMVVKARFDVEVLSGNAICRVEF